MDIQLSDLMESYPSWMTPKFQRILSAQKEFNELASPLSERKPKIGSYFRHQKFTHRFLRNFGNLLVMSATGTGKTCEVLGFPELSINELEKYREGQNADMKVARYTRHIILVKGKSQVFEIMDQLICACSDGKYITETIKNAETKKIQRKLLKSEIKKYGYEIHTYRKFAKNVKRLYEENDYGNLQLESNYNNTIFWMDEAHVVTVDPSFNYKEKAETYHQLWRVTHASPSNKIILATATPMLNDPNELISLMNLILPKKGDMPPKYDYRTAPKNDIRVLFPGLKKAIPNYKEASRAHVAKYFIGQMPENMDISAATLDDLEPFFRGKINYVRSPETGAIPIEQGTVFKETITTSSGVSYETNLTLYTSEMSAFQTEAYKKAADTRKDKNKEIYIPARAASNFVFPDGTWGNELSEKERKIVNDRKLAKTVVLDSPEKKEEKDDEEDDIFKLMQNVAEGQSYDQKAFKKYVTYESGKFSAKPELKKHLKSLESIRKLSTKYASIIEKVIYEPGNAFIYEEFITGSGAIVLALCLENLVLEKEYKNTSVKEYNETDSIFYNTPEEEIESSFCPIRGSSDFMVAKKERKSKIKKQLRYALYIDSMPDAKLHSIMETMNSYENRHSEYIKIFITTRIGREGININNGLQVHLNGSGWNESVNYQAISRVLRATSFQDIIDEQKRELVAKGEDPSTANVIVKIYKHAAVPRGKKTGGIDMNMYKTALAKDIEIKKIFRYMKQCSVGCMLHYGRNVRNTDVDGSAACDYSICNYSCVDAPMSNEIEYTNYNLLYSKELVEATMYDMSELFQYDNILSLQDIIRALPNHEPIHIIMALENFIVNKWKFTDKFGYICYMKENENMFYMDKVYPAFYKEQSILDAYYTDYLIGIEPISLQDVQGNIASKYQETILEKIESMDVTKKGNEIKAMIETLSIDGKSFLLENALKIHVVKPTAYTTFIVEYFSKNLYHMREPVTQLHKARESIRPSSIPKRGRKRNLEKVVKITKIPLKLEDLPVEEKSPFVWVHTLYTEKLGTNAYSIASNFSKKEGKTRLLEYESDPVHAEWRDIEGIELQVYNAYIQKAVGKETKKYEEKGIYGFVVSDKEFRIRDPTTETKKAKTDARSINRGKICKTWSKEDLIHVSWELKVTPPPLEKKAKDFTKKEYVEALAILLKVQEKELTKWSEEKIVYYYQWYAQTKKWTREVICEKIKDQMKKDGKLLE